MKPMYKLGDMLYPANCSKDYQLDNPIFVNYIAKHEYTIIVDSKPTKISHYSYAENKDTHWMESALTNKLSKEEIKCQE